MTAPLDLLSAIDTAFAAVVAPAGPCRTLAQLCDGLRVVEGARDPVPLDWRRHPVQRAFVEAWDSGLYRTFVLAGPVQDGKTTIGLAAVTVHQIVEDRRPVLIAGPRLDDCEAVWSAKGRPMMVASGFADLLPPEGAGSRTGVPDEQLFGSGCRLYLRGAGGANQAQQALVTARAVLVTEVDSIAKSKLTRRRAQDESPGRQVIELLDRRRNYFRRDGRMVLESTVKMDQDSLILQLWGESSRGRVWCPCPSCGAWTVRAWAQVAYDPSTDGTALESARLACPSCGVLMSPADASDAAARGRLVHDGQRIEADQVVGAAPPSAVWGALWTTLDSPFTDLGLRCQEHRQATVLLRDHQDGSKLRQWRRDYLTEGCPDDDDEIRPPEAVVLAERSAASDYERGHPPFDGIRVGAIDQQERELWWLAMVVSADRSAYLDWGVEYLCPRHDQPTPDQRRAALDRCRAHFQRLAIPDRHCGVDVGGRGYLDVTDPWLRATGWAWWAIRGDGQIERAPGNEIKADPGYYREYRRDDGRRLLMVEAAPIKDRIAAGLAAPIDSPIAILFPHGVAAGDHLPRHLGAEVKRDGKWVRIHPRNDLLDLTVYARAIARRVSIQPVAGKLSLPILSSPSLGALR
jgi:phage terminase large subunit GpA-like protein